MCSRYRVSAVIPVSRHIDVYVYQVAPAELEALLLAHPKVLDSAVVPIPCDETGELPRAYIVAKPDVNISDQDIHDYIKGKLCYSRGILCYCCYYVAQLNIAQLYVQV